MAGYTVGSPVFIGEDLIIVDTQYQTPQVFISNKVTIAQRVTLVTASGAPESKEVYKIFRSRIGPIIIKDGVWIGAGAVVTKDVSPCTVVAGVPARLLSDSLWKLAKSLI